MMTMSRDVSCCGRSSQPLSAVDRKRGFQSGRGFQPVNGPGMSCRQGLEAYPTWYRCDGGVFTVIDSRRRQAPVCRPLAATRSEDFSVWLSVCSVGE